MLTLWLLVGFTIAVTLHIGLLAGFHALARMRLELVSLFVGPTVATWMWGETRIRIHLLPLGGYVKMDGEDYARHPRVLRVVLLLLAPGLLLLLGWLLAGVDPVNLAMSLLRGIMHPGDVGVPLLHAYRDRFMTGAEHSLGTFFLAMAMANLAPVPICNGGQALLTMVAAPPRVVVILGWVSLPIVGAALVSAASAYCKA